MIVRFVGVKILERWDSLDEHWEPVLICEQSSMETEVLLAIIAESSPTKRRYRVAEYVKEEEV